MSRIKNPEHFFRLYNKLPKEIQDAIFSAEVADYIGDICERNGIYEHVSMVAEYAGDVLLGVLPPNNFQKELEQELKLEPDLAKQVTYEINRFIFRPIRDLLAELYEEKIISPAKPLERKDSKTKEEPKIPQKPETPQKPDAYREIIK